MNSWLAIALIALAGWKPLRAALSSRMAVAYPQVSSKLRWAFVALAAGVAAAAVFAPSLLTAGAAAALLLAVAELWYARPAWGRRRGLPPGSLGIFPANWADDRFYLRQAGRHGPVFKTSNFLRPTACIVGLERGYSLLRESGDKLETPRLPFADNAPGGLLRYMKGAVHERYRGILRGALNPQTVDVFSPRFSSAARGALAGMAEQCGAEKCGLEPAPLVDELLLDIWLPLFFAIEPGSDSGRRIRSLLPLLDSNSPAANRPEVIRKAVATIAGLVEEETSRWGPSPPPCLLSAVMAVNESDARDPVVVGNLMFLLRTTSSDMRGLLCWLLYMMCENPAWLERLAAEPETSQSAGAESLATRMVMETLRLRQSEYLYREAVADIEFGGYRIPCGWLVRICVWESHRDPQVFAEPDEFNPDRFLGRSFSRYEYSPLGALGHACLAGHLVMRVGSAFLSELARGYEVHAAAPGTIELGSYRHWKPAPSWRIRLSPRR